MRVSLHAQDAPIKHWPIPQPASNRSHEKTDTRRIRLPFDDSATLASLSHPYKYSRTAAAAAAISTDAQSSTKNDRRRSPKPEAQKGMSEAIEIQNMTAADHNMPAGHVVQALEDRYIKATVLQDALEKTWPENWKMFVSSCLLSPAIY